MTRIADAVKLTALAVGAVWALTLAFVVVAYTTTTVVAAEQARFPAVLVCPSGTQPWARYNGNPWGKSLDIECFNPADTRSPIVGSRP